MKPLTLNEINNGIRHVENEEVKLRSRLTECKVVKAELKCDRIRTIARELFTIFKQVKLSQRILFTIHAEVEGGLDLNGRNIFRIHLTNPDNLSNKNITVELDDSEEQIREKFIHGLLSSLYDTTFPLIVDRKIDISNMHLAYGDNLNLTLDNVPSRLFMYWLVKDYLVRKLL